MTPTVKTRLESGEVWERIDKRFVKPDDFHWCDSKEPERVTEETIPHVCGIWVKSEDQSWQPPEPIPTDEQGSPVDRLIQRVQLTAGDLDGGNIAVLAMLYQAKALEGIARSIGLIAACIEDLWDRGEWDKDSVSQAIKKAVPATSDNTD